MGIARAIRRGENGSHSAMLEVGIPAASVMMVAEVGASWRQAAGMSAGLTDNKIASKVGGNCSASAKTEAPNRAFSRRRLLALRSITASRRAMLL